MKQKIIEPDHLYEALTLYLRSLSTIDDNEYVYNVHYQNDMDDNPIYLILIERNK